MKKSIFKKITAIATCAAMIIPTFTMQSISAKAAEIETPEDIIITEEYDASLLNAISNMADYYLNDSSFGASINYSTGWYSGLSTVEILARLIYAEAPISNTSSVYMYEQRAISWVIINRRNANLSYFGGSNLRNIITYSGQFESITGGSSGTWNARNPDKSQYSWGDAVWLACAMTMTSNVSDYVWLIPKPYGIDNQISFLASSRITAYDGSPYIQIQFDNGALKDAVEVAYANIGYVASAYYANYYASTNRNIYFTYYLDWINI